MTNLQNVNSILFSIGELKLTNKGQLHRGADLQTMSRHFFGMKQDILRDLNLRVSALLSNRK